MSGSFLQIRLARWWTSSMRRDSEEESGTEQRFSWRTSMRGIRLDSSNTETGLGTVRSSSGLATTARHSTLNLQTWLFKGGTWLRHAFAIATTRRSDFPFFF